MTDVAKPTMILGGTAIKPVERVGWEKVRYILHNPETGEYLTRTPKSWALITLFYLVYYSCLAGFWAAMLCIFFTTLEDKSPKWVGEASIIGISPGLGLKPMQSDALIDSSMITFTLGVKEDQGEDGKYAGWGGWANRSAQFLDKYDTPVGSAKDCTAGNGVSGFVDYCKFDPAAKLGDCALENNGYDEGKPCIFLKLNRIYDVPNPPYNDAADLPEDMPADLKAHIATQTDKNQVWIHCKGEYPADVEGLGTLKYYPASQGIPNYYFPYLNQEGYQSPIVAVQFANAKENQLLHIECRAWAKNIGYSRRDRIGINHLELMIVTKNATELRLGEDNES